MTQSLPMPVKVKPYAHQQAAFEYACKHFELLETDSEFAFKSRGVAFLMEMGTGKSLTSIGVTGALYLTGRIKRALIVCPLSIVSVWSDEFRKFAEFDFHFKILNDKTAAKKGESLLKMKSEILEIAVINYESAKKIVPAILKWRPDLVIADEGHKMKNHASDTSKAMHKIGAAAQYKLLLTGTLISNKAVDVFSQYKFLNPYIFGMAYYPFLSRYFILGGFGGHTPFIIKSMQPELNGRILSVAFCATKNECLDLPEKTDVIRLVELEPKAAKIYNQLVQDSYAELKSGEIIANNVLTKLLRLSQVTGGFVSREAGAKPELVSTAKLDALRDIVDGVLQDNGKIVIIARFVAEIKAICDMLEKSMKVKYSLIMGGVKDRDEQVRRFQNDPEIPVFVGQIATAGLGITLTAASTLVFYSLDYSYANFEQTKARIHRVGQTNKCTYIYLMACKTIDYKILKALQNKADLAQTLIDAYKGGENPFG